MNCIKKNSMIILEKLIFIGKWYETKTFYFQDAISEKNNAIANLKTDIIL